VSFLLSIDGKEEDGQMEARGAEIDR